MIDISEYWGAEGRRSKILMDTDGTYVVDCFSAESLQKRIVLNGKSIYFAEDTAENWVDGIIKE